MEDCEECEDIENTSALKSLNYNKRTRRNNSTRTPDNESKNLRLDLTEENRCNDESKKIFVCIAGNRIKLAALAKKKPVAMKKDIINKCGPINEFQINGNSMRLNCENEAISNRL